VPCLTMFIRECTVEEMEQRPHANQSPATDPKRFNHALSQKPVELGLAKTGLIACLRYRTSRTLLKRNNRLRRNVPTSFLKSNLLFHGCLFPLGIRESAGRRRLRTLRLAAILRWEERSADRLGQAGIVELDAQTAFRAIASRAPLPGMLMRD
jgi:hypothetical protein